MIKVLTLSALLMALVGPAVCQKITVDSNVREAFKHNIAPQDYVSIMVFFSSEEHIKAFKQKMASFPDATSISLKFMPVVILTSHPDEHILEAVSEFPSVSYVALNKPADEKIEINPNSNKPKTPFRYPGIARWWAKNFTGQSGVIGIIDSGVDASHPAFLSKKIIINNSKNSGFANFPEGIRSPHGTGVACIYAGNPLDEDENVRGLAYKAPVILSSLAGEGNKNKENYWMTYNSLKWFFSLKSYKVSVINYSFGNGPVTCPDCPDWSGMSKVVDYIVNKYKILWVTSAGNNGYVQQSMHAPYTSTMTVPADNYNALTVANMNMYAADEAIAARRHDRRMHAIRFTSSRGPTLLGRKKPDITAPGNDTYTCAPDPKKYHSNELQQKNYEKGYRFMGGTSAAAPHVGAAVLLVQEAGITDPLAIKALLINSADAWTDSNKPGPDDPAHSYQGGHFPVVGTHWNPTYGWGYMNMNNAFNQRTHILSNSLSLSNPTVEYKMQLMPEDKITLVHERRVGFNELGLPWELSHLKLEIIENQTHQVLAVDDSILDNVHQVSICSQHQPSQCTLKGPIDVMIRVILLSNKLEGAEVEPYAVVYS